MPARVCRRRRRRCMRSGMHACIPGCGGRAPASAPSHPHPPAPVQASRCDLLCPAAAQRVRLVRRAPARCPLQAPPLCARAARWGWTGRPKGQPKPPPVHSSPPAHPPSPAPARLQARLTSQARRRRRRRRCPARLLLRLAGPAAATRPCGPLPRPSPCTHTRPPPAPLPRAPAGKTSWYAGWGSFTAAWVPLHESGHALGLGHSSYAGGWGGALRRNLSSNRCCFWHLFFQQACERGCLPAGGGLFHKH